MLALFDIPKEILPRIVPSSGLLGEMDTRCVDPEAAPRRIPIAGLAGDQQAALFGQGCFEPGQMKCTYGTGAFLLLNTGRRIVRSASGLMTTVAWDIGDGPVYALEGSVFQAGSAIQWLRDELGLIPDTAACEREAAKVADSGGCSFVPAFTGLGAPHWNMRARGMLIGLRRDIGRAHICRAALESIAHQTAEVCLAMERDTGERTALIRVDGGVARSGLMLQFQAELLNCALERPACLETTALGAAFLAGLAVGFWPSTEALRGGMKMESRYFPLRTESWRAEKRAAWRRAVDCVLYDADRT